MPLEAFDDSNTKMEKTLECKESFNHLQHLIYTITNGALNGRNLICLNTVFRDDKLFTKEVPIVSKNPRRVKNY